MRIYDPFCGTATTALSAAYHGHKGITTDINPFLIWLGRAKTACYSASDLSHARSAGMQALELIKHGNTDLAPAPPIFKIERWWAADALKFLRALRSAIDATASKGSAEHTLLLVAFCRTLIALSNASFNHQSMSFKGSDQLTLIDVDMPALFADDLTFVLKGAAENPREEAEVILGDARDPGTVVQGQIDRVITSPPYANRMSYIRELRPYMYWLGYLVDARDAGELDWSAIGGTWGMATSRLSDWERPSDHFRNESLTSVLTSISHDENHSGHILANYVAKYFDDMWAHFRNLTPLLAPGAELHYIVGNSTFYGVLLSVERLYGAMLQQLGFEEVECRPIRKRNSKKELIEFDVVAKWPG